MSKGAQFGRFKIPESSIFHKTTNTFAFVNLRPIVPGHVLVSPYRVVPKLNELSESEYCDLWNSVRTVQTILQAQYNDCTAFNVAVQDGAAAGQSVAHVHVHILPRSVGDLERNDDIYDALQDWEPLNDSNNPKQKLEVPDDANRRDRTSQEMQDEAEAYRSIAESLLGDK